MRQPLIQTTPYPVGLSPAIPHTTGEPMRQTLQEPVDGLQCGISLLAIAAGFVQAMCVVLQIHQSAP